MPDAARTRIEFRQFRCPAGHEFRATCKSLVRPGAAEPEEFYRTDDAHWLPIPKCPVPDCTLIGCALADPTAAPRSFAQVPAAERFYAWLSPDGERVAVPGYRGAAMPERYRRAGYSVVEAANLQQLAQLEAVRSRQTGNSAYHEVSSFDAATRAARERAEYSDDTTRDT